MNLSGSHLLTSSSNSFSLYSPADSNLSKTFRFEFLSSVLWDPHRYELAQELGLISKLGTIFEIEHCCDF